MARDANRGARDPAAAVEMLGEAGTAETTATRHSAQARRRAEFLWLYNLIRSIPDLDGNAALARVRIAVLSEIARPRS